MIFLHRNKSELGLSPSWKRSMCVYTIVYWLRKSRRSAVSNFCKYRMEKSKVLTITQIPCAKRPGQKRKCSRKICYPLSSKQENEVCTKNLWFWVWPGEMIVWSGSHLKEADSCLVMTIFFWTNPIRNISEVLLKLEKVQKAHAVTILQSSLASQLALKFFLQ